MNNRYQMFSDPLVEQTAVADPQNEVYSDLVTKCPVLHRRDDAPTVISNRDDIVFINQQRTVLGNGEAGTPMGANQKLIPLDIDGPEHTKFRRLLDPLFAPRAATSQIVGLEPTVRRLANELIDTFIEDGEVELNTAFCVPLPTIIFVDLLGLPQKDRMFFIAFKDDILHPVADTPEERAEIRARAPERMFAYLNEQITLREENPDDYPGLLTGLLFAEIEGERLSRRELLNIFLLLVIAGLDTVTGSLSSMFARLAGHPDEQQQLRDDPSLVPTAIEELLRWESPVQWAHRKATVDMTLPSGYEVAAGEYLQVVWAAANLDPQAFSEPMKVKLDREPNRHLAFASGVHRCLGSHLARMELRCALDEMHKRLANYRIDPSATLNYSGGTVRGASQLPLIFDRNDSAPTH